MLGVPATYRSRRAQSQPLHGDTQSRNLLWTDQVNGIWIDFESVCRGPLEWDYVKIIGSERVNGLDHDLQIDLLNLTSACVATWCWQKEVRAPEVQEAAEYHLRAIKQLEAESGH